jgi:hypothetical protein
MQSLAISNLLGCFQTNRESKHNPHNVFKSSVRLFPLRMFVRSPSPPLLETQADPPPPSPSPPRPPFAIVVVNESDYRSELVSSPVQPRAVVSHRFHCTAIKPRCKLSVRAYIVPRPSRYYFRSFRPHSVVDDFVTAAAAAPGVAFVRPERMPFVARPPVSSGNVHHITERGTGAVSRAFRRPLPRPRSRRVVLRRRTKTRRQTASSSACPRSLDHPVRVSFYCRERVWSSGVYIEPLTARIGGSD